MEWKINDNGKLERKFQFENFSDAMVFVNKVAEIAEERNHHPDILIHDYKNVLVTLFTHEKNEISDKDRKLAELINDLDKEYVLNQ